MLRTIPIVVVKFPWVSMIQVMNDKRLKSMRSFSSRNGWLSGESCLMIMREEFVTETTL